LCGELPLSLKHRTVIVESIDCREKENTKANAVSLLIVINTNSFSFTVKV